jgi:hypothetical protein
MTLPLLAEAEALAGWLGVDLDAARQARADVVLAHASAAVRVEASRNWVDADGALDGVPVGIPEIVVQVAARMWANPTGVEAQTTGPFSAQYSPLDLTDGEKQAIAAALRRGTTGGLRTISTTRGDLETMSTVPDGYVAVAGQDGYPVPARVPS